MSEEAKGFFQPGEKFHGYVVEKRLGAGGVGAVYLVRHELLDALYALKALDPAVAEGDPTYVKRFLREARLATRVRHPNLVGVHDCGFDEDKQLYYLVMDYVPGGSLRDALAFEGRLSVERAAGIVAQVASALDAARAYQVVHRDIKPENIMIQPDGRVKLVDLGIAKAKNLGDSLRTKTDSVFGTPSYISPEQAQNSSDVDARADIYSLGVVFFEMLTGRCPYLGKNPAQILVQILSDDPVPDIRDLRPDFQPELAILVRRMTAKDRNRRFGSFEAVLAELRHIGLGHVVEQYTPVELAEKPTEGMKTLLNGLEQPAKAADTDPLAAPDDDLRDFLSKRTRRRLTASRQKLIFILAAGILGLLLVVLAVL